MTVRQLYYTSCEYGRDGGFGFQVNAATPGIPQWAEDLAVRASSYEPSSVPLDREGNVAAERFPVALGFARAGSSATVYQSRYVGRDFAGRLGNYFAHAVVLEDAPRDLGGLLPIDLWSSSLWVHVPTRNPVLPEAPPLTPGTRADPAATAAFMAPAGRRRQLAGLLTAIAEVLSVRKGRVVLVSGENHEAALWVSAITRSLPRHLALATTFTTYSAHPHAVDAVLVCTTPDIHLRPHSGITVVDVRANRTAEPRPASPFASAVAEIWGWGDGPVRQAVLLVETGGDSLGAAALDAVAPAIRLFARAHRQERRPGELQLGLTEVATGLQAALTWLHPPSTPRLWNDLWEQLHEGLLAEGRQGPLPNTLMAITGDVLRAATGRGIAVPELLLVDYARLTVQGLLAARETTTQPTWFPRLSRDQWADIAARHLGSWPASNPSPQGLQTLHDMADEHVRAAMASVLDATDSDELELVVALPLTAAHLLLPALTPGWRADRLVRLVRARHDDIDPVSVVLPLLERTGDHPWHQLDELLMAVWPQGIGPQDALRLLRRLGPKFPAHTDFVRHCIVGIVDDARAEQLCSEHAELAEALLHMPLADHDRGGEQTLRAVVLGFSSDWSAGRLQPDELRAALDVAAGVMTKLGQWFLHRLASAVLAAEDALQHHALLVTAASGEHHDLLPAYVAEARSRGVAVDVAQLARWTAVWALIVQEPYQQELLERTLPEVLARRRNDVERLSKILACPPQDVLTLANKQGVQSDALVRWWAMWRRRHHKSTLSSRLAAATRLRKS
jgi:hypothetical protein